MTKRRLLMDLLSNFVAFVVFFNVFFILYAGLHREMTWWYLLLAVPFYGLWLLRKFVRDIGIFLLLHLVLIVPPFFIFSDTGTMWFVVSFFVISTVYSIFMRIKGEHLMKFSTAVISVGLIFAGFVVMGRVMVTIGYVQGATQVATFSALAVLIAVILFVQMDNLHFDLSMIRSHTGDKKRTEKKVFNVNNMLVASFSVLVAVFAIAAMFVPGGRVIAFLWRPIEFVINQVVRFVTFIMGLIIPEIGEMEPPERDDDFGVPMEFDYMEEDEEIPGQLFFILMGSFIIAGIAIGVIIGIIMIARAYLARKRRQEQGGRDAHDDAVDNLQFSLKDLAAFLPKLSFAPKHPVRKAYYKKVNGHIKQGIRILPSYTPEVIADRIRHQEDIDELTDAYEAVRYGRNN